MNIKDIFFKPKKAEDLKYAGPFRRGTATIIDLWIVLFLRAFSMYLMSRYWLEQQVVIFRQEFMDHFGTAEIKNTPEHIDFVLHSTAFIYMVIFYLVVLLIGAFYHAGFNASQWQGTIGKRITKIMIVKNNDEKISFLAGASHYFLSILPFLFVFYLVAYKVRHNLSFFQTITASEANVFFGILFVIWLQIHLFTKKKTTAYDLICGTVLINGRTAAIFPWSKNLKDN